ncbi:MAG: AAA family ATPase, partial [Planctomycetaceae bacterium]|nr:AAA family ATPase [Planctomycetaceae bacterium]
MEITVPVYVESVTERKRTLYRVRPLFRPGPYAQAEMLEQAYNRLTHELRELLIPLGRMPRHDELAEWTFYPELKTQTVRVRIHVRRQTALLKLLLVTLEHFDRRIGFTPAFPDVWFEITGNVDPVEHLAECVSQHLTRRNSDAPSDETPLTDYGLKGTAWVTELDVRINPPRIRTPQKMDLRAILGADAAIDGEMELYQVGRSLNRLFPDDLHRAVLREAEVSELSRLLSLTERRAILLTGPGQSGKTAVLHEHVYRFVETHGRSHKAKQAVWLISPQRLISGMCYVGQWESRFHAIAEYAAINDQVLYFDDMMGLFQAGTSSQSSLNVAQLLRSVAERQQVRIVAEMTPEELRVFRERDRSFADMFHVIPVNEMQGDDNLRVQISLQRQLEYQHRCHFDLECLPAVIDLQRRYNSSAAFPGKAAQFLRRLAVAGTQTSEEQTNVISRDDVLQLFHEQSGLPQSFPDQRAMLPADEIRQGLRRRFVGQDAAVEAAVEIISIAKARLNDPGRPLASLLLTGPTGVGKTEFARTLAEYLFGNVDRLLRFDMNEYVSLFSVTQLVGTFHQPEGLLTAFVRRQPF